LGNNGVLVPAANIKELARVINLARGNRELHAKQLQKLNTHDHVSTPQATINTLKNFTPKDSPAPKRQKIAISERPKIAFATPWPPQQSGIADFSHATISELSQLADVTLFTTSGADTTSFTSRNVRELIETPEVGQEFDYIVSVLGNSSFHVPFFDLLNYQNATVISHDTRFIEYYAALSGGGVENLMLKTVESHPRGRIEPPLSQQIDDMRLIQNMGFWEVARKAKQIIMHTPMAVPLISKQVGYTPNILPFANYRAPQREWLTSQSKTQARENLGFDQHPVDTIHLASFGFVDNRTKMADVLVEAAAWLTQWGHSVALYLVGSAQPDVAAELTARAKEVNLVDFAVTGYTSEEQYRDYLLATDLGVQLRISPYLGVAGPLSDMAAFGRPALGSRGVCIDVDTPDFIDQLPDDVSSVMVAQAIEYRIKHPHKPEVIEAQRLEYLRNASPKRYAKELLNMLRNPDQQGVVVR
jgi:glycosyltransferase involved in cell wall biosynthesis